MKKNIKAFFPSLMAISVLLLAFSCVEPDDLITENAKAGGLIKVTSTQVSYLSGQESEIGVVIPENAGITSVEFYKSYIGKTESSNEVLDNTIDISGAGTFKYSLDFAALREGLTIGGDSFTEDDGDLGIGEYWNFRIVSTLEDGRKVESAFKIKIVVSNPYSGVYHATGMLHHPTAGDLEIDEDRTLTPISPTTSTTIVGYFGNDTYSLIITVNGDNSITIDGDVAGNPVINDTTYGTSHYDPETGDLHLFYTYNAAAPRRFEEVLSKN